MRIVYTKSFPSRFEAMLGLERRKAVTAQRDAFASLAGLSELPGFDREDEHYFRDVYDHLIPISDLIDN